MSLNPFGFIIEFACGVLLVGICAIVCVKVLTVVFFKMFGDSNES